MAPIKAKPAAKAEIKMPEWWNPSLCGEITPDNPFGKMVLDYSVRLGKPLSHGYCKGILENNDDPDAFTNLLKALASTVSGSQMLSRGPIFGRGESETWINWPNGSMAIKVGLDSKISIEMLTTDPNQHMALGRVIGDHMLPSNVRQPVYTIAKVQNELEIVEVGRASDEIERGNYTDEVLEHFDFLIAELQREEPTGRLTLIHGDPGTGKSYLIRGLMHEILDAIFVLIPSHMVQDLTGPELIPTLIKARGLTGSEDPIILILEDADKALVKRDKDSIAAISSLLNASDGILGLTLNLRIVCTTNAALPDVDEALKRPGRMSRDIHIGVLPPEKCAEVFERLTDTSGTFEESMSLAEVYRFANLERIDEEEGDTDEDETEDEDDDEDWDDDDTDDDDDDEGDDEE